ncbi:MAG: methylisocitrate lyase [Elusimicrobia bacterium CG_4_10_14_0_2_um_filter_56_8]|nr:MAG: methylisocitrate lyase [Elusimicrobia bacterium CG1_02_56_21]PJA13766.1 MAG: methylisocitrate lyase [Elusimicrobia bacterium CG_4_10_14_0_2_um_filter_56_8]
MEQTEILRKKFKSLVLGKGVVLPGAFNALTARLIEEAGFKGVYISGAGLNNGAGFPDIGLLTLTEFAAMAKYITGATSLPCICDADTGFGEAVNVARCVSELEQAGLAGIHIEDQVFPKRCGHLSGKQLIPVEQMARKIKTAVLSRKDKNFLIIARTDARSVESFDKAVERARAYAKAGADVIFAEALKTSEEFARFARKVKTPLLANMTEFGVSPLLSSQELLKMGYKIVIYPMGAFRTMMKACEGFYAAIKKEGTQAGILDKMQTRKELYALLDYDSYTKLDEKAYGDFRGNIGKK